jgi:hypothetical protein
LSRAALKLAPGLNEGFTHDDLMNLSKAVITPRADLALDALLVFRQASVYRPAGELLYRAVFEAFGFNPPPFHIIRLH